MLCSKPLKAIRESLKAVVRRRFCSDLFAHSGTTLIAAEQLGHGITADIDPIFAEVTIRRLEHYRKTGKTGWQWQNPFPEIDQIF